MAGPDREWSLLLPPVPATGAFRRYGNNAGFLGLTEAGTPAGSRPGTPPPGSRQP